MKDIFVTSTFFNSIHFRSKRVYVTKCTLFCKYSSYLYVVGSSHVAFARVHASQIYITTGCLRVMKYWTCSFLLEVSILPLHLIIAFTLSSVTPTGSLLRHQHRHHCRRCLRHFHHLSTALVEQGTPKWTFPINCFCCLSMNNLSREKKWKRTLVCTGVLDGVDALVLRVEFLGNKLTKSSTVLTNLSFCAYGNFIFALQLCP